MVDFSPFILAAFDCNLQSEMELHLGSATQSGARMLAHLERKFPSCQLVRALAFARSASRAACQSALQASHLAFSGPVSTAAAAAHNNKQEPDRVESTTEQNELSASNELA